MLPQQQIKFSVALSQLCLSRRELALMCFQNRSYTRFNRTNDSKGDQEHQHILHLISPNNWCSVARYVAGNQRSHAFKIDLAIWIPACAVMTDDHNCSDGQSPFLVLILKKPLPPGTALAAAGFFITNVMVRSLSVQCREYRYVVEHNLPVRFRHLFDGKHFGNPLTRRSTLDSSQVRIRGQLDHCL
jgi:hypothetical protein